LKSASLILFAIALAAPAARAQQRFSNPTAGLSIDAPAGWGVLSMQQVMDNRAKVRVPDETLQAGIQNSTAPLFVFAKYPEPHSTLNPTIQIVLRPRPRTSDSATALLSAAMVTVQRAYPDFRYREPVRATRVSGMPASMKATYTIHTQSGTSHPVLARMWLVPRGSYLFLIGMSGAQDGSDVSEEEFTAALQSIHIQP
jgi:hypothetical protein